MFCSVQFCSVLFSSVQFCSVLFSSVHFFSVLFNNENLLISNFMCIFYVSAMHYQCNSTYYCNITTTYKYRGTCIEYTDCATFPCQVTGCKPTIEPVPGFCEEVGCYVIEKPSSENYLTIVLSSGFGIICLLVLLLILVKRDVLKVNRLRVVGNNIKLCLQQSIANFQLCILQCCMMKCLSGIGWVLENVPSCGFFMRFILWILQCLCCCLKNEDTEETRRLVFELRDLPMDDSIQMRLHSANIQQTNR